MCEKISGNDNSHTSPTKEVKYHYPDEFMVITRQLLSMQYTSVHNFAIICVLCMSIPPDASQSTSQACLHMWIYQMEIDGYPHAD